ncbi:hypothetical protein SAY86_011253 [Trapa natans]|uniref:Ubiquitin carboxyl-terminal hydrolase n=1 Tax=Trapa natans TaxID=22666 RepID=A0AAN7LTI6_TRANT|nr:hypothetical protein SAY86_011253 [Trapa natans]
MTAEVSLCSSSVSGQLTPEEERVLIRDIALAAEADARVGATFYLLAQRWWQQWIEYVNLDQPNNINDGSSLSENCDSAGPGNLKKPGVIDNSDLIYDCASEETSTGIDIHDTLLEGRDYVLLPHEVWNQLFTWYGGGPALPRKVISSGLSQTELAVEVYPLRLQLLVMQKDDHATIRISKKETIGNLHKKACEVFNLNPEQVCIWDYYGHQKHALIDDMDKTLDDANIQMDQDILVEVHDNANGTACIGHGNGTLGMELSKSNLSIAGGFTTSRFSSRGCNSGLSTSNFSLGVKGTENTYGISGMNTRGLPVGLTGLQNLGNTCFMNSAIQCLVHTPELARYFQEDYHREINWHNPLGMVGELAMAFGELLRKLWVPGRFPVAPRAFKVKLARFAPQFSGYNQHDSQELLAFLLDGLHEDLNRVKDKPYIKSRDADGRSDEEVADEYWANHIARNDSIIVDVCQGQYKSTLICPLCNKISVTFDPFMYLSLPLQFASTRSMTVTVFTCDGSSLPFAYTVAVPKQGRCSDLILALSNACSLQATEKLLLSEIKDQAIHRMVDDPLTLLSTFKDDDHLAAYKIPKLEKNAIYLCLALRCQEQASSDTQTGWKPYGTPLVAAVSADEIESMDIHRTVHKMLSPFLRDNGLEKSDHSDMPDKNIDTSSSSQSDTMPKLPIQLVDENNALTDLFVGEEAVKFSSSSFIHLVINWSTELSVKYDIPYLENLPEVCNYGHVSKKARTDPLSLYNCLEAFLSEEPLVPEEMWYCPQCKERRQASKKLDLWRLPEVLVIHLKRFSYSRSKKHKIGTFVNFPIHDFDLTDYVPNKKSSARQLYELYALINHYGTSIGSGHYTANIKLLDENRWYNFDDSLVTPINEDEVISSGAYVLFYRRVKTVSGGA